MALFADPAFTSCALPVKANMFSGDVPTVGADSDVLLLCLLPAHPVSAMGFCNTASKGSSVSLMYLNLTIVPV